MWFTVDNKTCLVVVGQLAVFALDIMGTNNHKEEVLWCFVGAVVGEGGCSYRWGTTRKMTGARVEVQKDESLKVLICRVDWR